MQLSTLFDPEIKPPSTIRTALEYLSLAELGAFMLCRPFFQLLPPGDGHAVIIIPGFVQDGLAVIPMQQSLRRLGYQAHAWDQGTNLGFSRATLASLREQTESLVANTGKRVSVIGWSVGGLFARELAFSIPQHLRLVITLAAPFGRNPKASRMRWIYDRVNKNIVDGIDDEMLLRIRQPLPVPSTAIYSRQDGIVAWQTCIEETLSDSNENVEVLGTHSGLGFNVQVLNVIADRLAQKIGAWKPMSAPPMAYPWNAWTTVP